MSDPVPLHPVSDDAKESCGKCVYYFDPAGNTQTGLCRRFPPGVFVVGHQQMVGGTPALITQAAHPPMERDGWCGEFSPRSVEKVVSGYQGPSFIPLTALDPPKESLDPVVVDRPEEPLPDPSGGGQDAA